MAYSIDFRKKVLSYCERTGSITEASDVFQISRNTIYGWLKLKEKTGELNHQVKGTKPRKVDRDRLKNYLTDNPDAYLTEIASESTSASGTIKSTGDSGKQLPNTGSEDSNSSLLLGALAAITGLGLFVKRSKDESEDEI